MTVSVSLGRRDRSNARRRWRRARAPRRTSRCRRTAPPRRSPLRGLRRAGPGRGRPDAPVLGRHGDVATQVCPGGRGRRLCPCRGVRRVAAALSSASRCVVLCGAALGGFARFSGAAAPGAHARDRPSSADGACPSPASASPSRVALLPMAAMHVLLGIPDGSCRLSRARDRRRLRRGRGGGPGHVGRAPGAAAVARRHRGGAGRRHRTVGSQRRYVAVARRRTPAHAVVRMGPGRRGRDARGCPGAAGAAGLADPRRAWS